MSAVQVDCVDVPHFILYLKFNFKILSGYQSNNAFGEM